MIYHRPNTINDAVKALTEAQGTASILAGGTDLLVQLRAGSNRPPNIVDIKGIKELMTISENNDGFVIGAGVPSAKINEHQGLKVAWPGVLESMDLIGSTQIQGRATMGGNLCNASPAADSVPAIIAAGAICSIAGPQGIREEKVENIVTGPGKTSLSKNEFVISLKLDKPKIGRGDAYLRLIPRTEMDIAVVGSAVCITIDDSGKCTDAKVVLGAVAPTQVIVDSARDILIGTKLDDNTIEKLAGAARNCCDPIDDKRGTIEYRTKIAGVLTKRAAKIALKRAEKS